MLYDFYQTVWIHSGAVSRLIFYFNVIQQIGDLEDTKAFILDITWPETYPETAPQISLDAFFNNRM